jgi:hypothetical protein
MGLCFGCFEKEPYSIPVPPDGIMEPLPGFEYIPLESYIVAVNFESEQRIYIPAALPSNPWNQSVFT